MNGIGSGSGINHRQAPRRSKLNNDLLLGYPVKLSFPNPSRSFDPTKNRVQFWGYLQSVEITFFVDAAILLKLQPDLEDNSNGMLAAFDVHADKIKATADKEYVRSGVKAASYNLLLSAF